jgi:hypothetical protein
MSHKITGPVYRCTSCDSCHKAKPDCLWVRRDDQGHDGEEWCLCEACRTRAKAKGIGLTNIDTDFPGAAA